MAAPAKKPAPPAEGAEAAPKKSKKMLFIILGVVLLAGGGGAAWFFTKGHAKEGEKAEEKHAEPPKPAMYLALDPAFVVNFEAQSQVRFLQISVQLLTYEPETAEMLKVHDPAIRNDLLMLFGGQKYEEVSTREGKDKLRAQSLETVRKIIAKAGGKPESVADVFFTSFVMQ